MSKKELINVILSDIEEKLDLSHLDTMDKDVANLLIMQTMLNRIIGLERKVDIGSTFPYIRPLPKSCKEG